MRDPNQTLLEDKPFKGIVVFSTGLGLALMLASLAAIRIGKVEGLQFAWHWTILLWMAAAAIWNWRFWNVVWQVQRDPTPQAKKRLIFHCGILFAIGLGAFLYPIRFIEQSYWAGIGMGLVTAFTFLGIMFWIIFRFARGFLEQDNSATKTHAGS
jgi:hypothetical protein